jgi:oligopeptide transport system substrate-binding protein
VVVEGTPKEVVVTATPAPAAAGPKVLRLNLGPGDVPTLDPSLATDTSSTQIIELTSVGLTRQNEETAAVEPGMAESWDIKDNEDGTQTVTFHLITGVPWVRWDGKQVVKVVYAAGRLVNIVVK